MIAAANPFTGKREQKAPDGVPVGGFSVFRERKWLAPVLQKIIERRPSVIVRDRGQILHQPVRKFEQRRSTQKVYKQIKPRVRSGSLMCHAFDVFKKERDGKFVWCLSANSMKEANAAIHELQNTASEFIIFNQETEERLTITPHLLPPKK